MMGMILAFGGTACQRAAIVAIRLCHAPFEQNVCITNQHHFSNQVNHIYLSCRFIAAPKDGQATISWYYADAGAIILIKQQRVAVGEYNSGHVFNYITAINQPPQGWQSGNYRLFIEPHYTAVAAIEKTFSIR